MRGKNEKTDSDVDHVKETKISYGVSSHLESANYINNFFK
jgi:hypothetical protein